MLLSGILALTLLLTCVYLLARFFMFLEAGYAWQDKLVAGALLLTEAFIVTHSLGYFLNLLAVATRRPAQAEPAPLPPLLAGFPPVAILVASYHEPLAVLEDTLTCFYNLTYPNKHLYFLDDTRYPPAGRAAEGELAEYRRSIDELCREMGVNLFRRRWRGAKAGIINDFLEFIAGRPREGFEFTANEEAVRREAERYLIVFDADMNPFPDFVEPLIARMEADPRLAFIQTPQYYSNFENNRVARAAGLQQAVFYEYICEGKSSKDAMFCCGTNVIFRREAFEDVGGFDESSVTEDIATSMKFHLTGWRSAYLNQVCASAWDPRTWGATSSSSSAGPWAPSAWDATCWDSSSAIPGRFRSTNGGSTSSPAPITSWAGASS